LDTHATMRQQHDASRNSQVPPKQGGLADVNILRRAREQQRVPRARVMSE
jgi:hypothetical protein